MQIPRTLRQACWGCGVLHDDAGYFSLHRRLESIVGEAGQLLREISALSENFVLRHGVSMEALEAGTAEILKEWQI